MNITINNLPSKFDTIPERESWNNQKKNEILMHKIHVYPAKFPAFLISKALQYATRKKIQVNSVGDIFCGCGTTALEAQRNNKKFWGCDINPVATLIAKVKSKTYDSDKLDLYSEVILKKFERIALKPPKRIIENERILYWFKINQINDLYRLLVAIQRNVPRGKYRDFFLVAFSNILKRTSLWLTKSIKPTKAKDKFHHEVQKTFKAQSKMMRKAVRQLNKSKKVEKSVSTIVNQNILNIKTKTPFLDMLITSPPYVTSYEYADLHQLSTLWLGFSSDYKELRNGTIGSLLYQKIKPQDITNLDPVAKKIYDSLVKRKSRSPKSVLKYFIDIKRTIEKSYALINPGGVAIFVIGNTTYKKVYIDNARYLTKCMLSQGFNELDVFKRKISSKILTPYRDNNGKFSSNKKHRKVYNYEFVVIGRKPNAAR